MSNKKDTTIKTYSSISHDFGDGYDTYFKEIAKPEADKFLLHIPKNGIILDVGCGTGTHSLYFKKQGYTVISIDLSSEMVKICKAKGLNASVHDLEKLQFNKESFDGIWCHTSLIHLDHKNKIHTVLENFYKILKKEGILFIALREGEGERWELYNNTPNTKRWFLYFREKEFKNYIPSQYTIQDFTQTKCKSRKFLNYHLLKQES